MMGCCSLAWRNKMQNIKKSILNCTELVVLKQRVVATPILDPEDFDLGTSLGWKPMQGGGAICRGGGAGRCTHACITASRSTSLAACWWAAGPYLDDDVESHEDEISDGLNTDGRNVLRRNLHSKRRYCYMLSRCLVSSCRVAPSFHRQLQGLCG